MKAMTGKDYPHLCDACRETVTATARANPHRWDDGDDPEWPCNRVYDLGLFCGGKECVNRPQVVLEKPYGVASRGYQLRVLRADTRERVACFAGPTPDSAQFKALNWCDRWGHEAVDCDVVVVSS